MPPKPDEIAENSSSNLKHTEPSDEPLYSSVKSPKSSGDEQDGEAEDVEEEDENEDEEEGNLDKQCSQEDTGRDGRKKEIYEHKVRRNLHCRFDARYSAGVFAHSCKGRRDLKVGRRGSFVSANL